MRLSKVIPILILYYRKDIFKTFGVVQNFKCQISKVALKLF